jgi:hypothetical protein
MNREPGCVGAPATVLGCADGFVLLPTEDEKGT